MILCTFAHFLMHIWRICFANSAVAFLGRFQRRHEKPSIPFTCAPFPCGSFRLRRVQSAARHPRDRGPTFVTRVPRSHREMCCNDGGLLHAFGGGDNWEIVAGDTWAPMGRDDVSPPTRYTHDKGLHTPGRHTNTHLSTTRWGGEDCKCD